MKKISFLLFASLIICISLGTIFLIPQTRLPTLSGKSSLENITKNIPQNFTIVIDPGHGGRDPGKVGTTGTLEKEINLKIALILKEILEKNGWHICLIQTKGYIEDPNSLAPTTLVVVASK